MEELSFHLLVSVLHLPSVLVHVFSLEVMSGPFFHAVIDRQEIDFFLPRHSSPPLLDMV